jgi:acyl carrier protein
VKGKVAEGERELLDLTVKELVELVREVAPEDLPPQIETRGAETIRKLGLTSVKMLEFMVEVEDRFGIEWEEELDPAAVSSFESMAEYVLETRSR